MTVPRGGQSLYGKTAAELMEEDVRVSPEGNVTGTFPYVEKFTGFNESDPSEQEGNYFWIKLGGDYAGKMKTVKRTSGQQGKENQSTDDDWILRLTDGTDTVFTIKAEGATDLTLTFAGATLKQKSV